MTRARHVGLIRRDADASEAVYNLAVHHITAIKRASKRGAITAVKHIEFGWISPRTYYRLQKSHELIPFALEVVKGGYMMKAAIYTVAVPMTIIGSGTSIPLGFLIVTVAIVLYAVDTAAGQPLYASLDLLSLLLPFGEIYLIWRGGNLIAQALSSSNQVSSWLASFTQGASSLPVELGGMGLQELSNLAGQSTNISPVTA